MSGRVITVNEATLRTLTVEIRSLTVSGKQVTQSVFRQLYDESVLAVDGSARGPLWGRVNYRWADHWHEHLVWQIGDELRSDSLPTTDRHFMLPRESWGRWQDYTSNDQRMIPLVLTILQRDNLVLTEAERKELADFSRYRLTKVDWVQSTVSHTLHVEGAWSYLRSVEVDPDLTPDEWREERRLSLERRAHVFATMYRTLAEIDDLPQLFIAV